MSGELELAFGVAEELEEHVLADRWGMTIPEVRYALAYADHLAVGEVEPSRAGLDPQRASKIRSALRAAWWGKVSRMSHGRGSRSRP